MCLKHHLVEADLLRQDDVPQELCRDCVVGLARRTLLASRLATDKKVFAKLLRIKDQPMYWVSTSSNRYGCLLHIFSDFYALFQQIADSHVSNMEPYDNLGWKSYPAALG